MKNTKSYLIFILIILSFLLFGACSDDDKNIIDPESDEEIDYEVSMSVSKQNISLFEETIISFDCSPRSRIDSVVSKINGVLYNKSGGGESWTYYIGQSFMLPGKYWGVSNVYALGELVASDTVEITVEDRGDCLGYKWWGGNAGGYAFKSRQKNNEFFVIPDFYEEPYPHITLRYLSKNRNTNDEEREQQVSIRSFFYDYITALYGASILEYMEEDITRIPNLFIEEYNKKFKTPLKPNVREDAYPLVFWETINANIVLVGYIDNEYNDPNGSLWRRFMIKAEPK